MLRKQAAKNFAKMPAPRPKNDPQPKPKAITPPGGPALKASVARKNLRAGDILLTSANPKSLLGKAGDFIIKGFSESTVPHAEIILPTKGGKLRAYGQRTSRIRSARPRTYINRNRRVRIYRPKKAPTPAQIRKMKARMKARKGTGWSVQRGFGQGILKTFGVKPKNSILANKTVGVSDALICTGTVARVAKAGGMKISDRTPSTTWPKDIANSKYLKHIGSVGGKPSGFDRFAAKWGDEVTLAGIGTAAALSAWKGPKAVKAIGRAAKAASGAIRRAVKR